MVFIPIDAKAGKAKMQISLQKNSKSPAKVHKIEFPVEIMFGEARAPLHEEKEWLSQGWDPELSTEENMKKMREFRIKQSQKYISGTDEVKYRISPYGGETFTPGEDKRIMISLTIKDGYHTYGIKEGEGYKNTEMNWELPEGFELISCNWPEPTIKKQGEFELPVYKKQIHFRAYIKTPSNAVKGKKYKINVNTIFQYCNHESCWLGEANNLIEMTAK